MVNGIQPEGDNYKSEILMVLVTDTWPNFSVYKYSMCEHQSKP